MKEKTKLEYPVKAYRLHPVTVKRLAKLKEERGLSYNLLILDLLDTYGC